MVLLIIGLGIWCIVHFIPSLAAGFRNQLVEKLGMGKYRLVFSILIFISIILMVFGYRSITPTPLYTPPSWGAPVAVLLVLVGFILFAASHAKTNIKRIIRHPQLTGMALWSAAHLLANGDSRSLLLFGVLGIWAMLEMVTINRRDGVWAKPEAVGIKSDLLTVAKGAVVFVVVMFIHSFLGVPPLVR